MWLIGKRLRSRRSGRGSQPGRGDIGVVMMRAFLTLRLGLPHSVWSALGNMSIRELVNAAQEVMSAKGNELIKVHGIFAEYINHLKTLGIMSVRSVPLAPVLHSPLAFAPPFPRPCAGKTLLP